MTANDRFKQRYSETFGASLALASALIFLMFAYFPQLTSGDVTFEAEELAVVELPPEIDVPPPPAAISRPATPVLGGADIDEDITIAPTTFDENPVSQLPPPPTSGAARDLEADIGRAPVFTPMTERPRLLNTDEIRTALERYYPSMLRDAGIGGDVLVWFYINERGEVVNTELKEGSGYAAMDAAALKIAPMMKFAPAKNLDRIVSVWVEIAITFTSK